MIAYRSATGVASCALLAAFLAYPAGAADVTQQRLENADKEPQNWITTFQNYSGHRYSRLDQINQSNVKNLRVAFTVPLPTALKGSDSPGLENPPLVDDGMMYVSDTWGILYKIDVSNGVQPKNVWVSDPAIDKSGSYYFKSRGIALFGGRAFANLVDGRVVAFDTSTGDIVWDVKLAGLDDQNIKESAAEAFTAAPLAVNGKVLIGQSKGDWGTRGYLAALDSATGKQLWRTYTIPAKGEPGNETWKDDHNAWRTGGGALWTTGTYDAAQKVTIWGTANPVPMYDPEFRPGDNLFTNSAMAFDVDTGKMKWYFQYTPNESWDYDENGVHMLYDAQIGGETRKVVGHFARNGFFYQLDRSNGAFINATQYVDKITWTAGIDPKTGKPLEYDPAKAVQTYIPATRNVRGGPEITVCPTNVGGIRWQPPAYNPDKHLLFGAGLDGCTAITVKPENPVGPQGGNPKGVNQAFVGGATRNLGYYGFINAVDVTTGKTVAKAKLPYQNLSGALATSGGLVFTGQLDGAVEAFSDTTLQSLWRFYTGIPFKAPPIAYSVNGKEFIAIVAGGDAAPGGYPELKTMKQGAMLYVFTL